MASGVPEAIIARLSSRGIKKARSGIGRPESGSADSRRRERESKREKESQHRKEGGA